MKAIVAVLALLAGPACGAERAASPEPLPPGSASAVFAGGCFWCMEPPFDALDGVLSTTSGFTGGTVASPSYEQVTAGGTGHVEAVQVVYDPARVSYDRLLEVFWRNVDPLDGGGQFCDRGPSYRSALFVTDAAERQRAVDSKRKIARRLGKPVVTPIRAVAPFYAAEAYHQDYYRKNPVRYRLYRRGCGRDARLEALWGKTAGH